MKLFLIHTATETRISVHCSNRKKKKKKKLTRVSDFGLRPGLKSARNSELRNSELGTGNFRKRPAGNASGYLQFRIAEDSNYARFLRLCIRGYVLLVYVMCRADLYVFFLSGVCFIIYYIYIYVKAEKETRCGSVRKRKN